MEINRISRVSHRPDGKAVREDRPGHGRDPRPKTKSFPRRLRAQTARARSLAGLALRLWLLREGERCPSQHGLHAADHGRQRRSHIAEVKAFTAGIRVIQGGTVCRRLRIGRRAASRRRRWAPSGKAILPRDKGGDGGQIHRLHRLNPVPGQTGNRQSRRHAMALTSQGQQDDRRRKDRPRHGAQDCRRQPGSAFPCTARVRIRATPQTTIPIVCAQRASFRRGHVTYGAPLHLQLAEARVNQAV